MNRKKIQITFITSFFFFLVMCVPPQGGTSNSSEKDKAKLDSTRSIRCPQLMSTASENYTKGDYKKAVNRYKQAVKYDCANWNKSYAEQLYQYFAISYERLGHFDSAETVCLSGLELMPNDKNLRIRLSYAYKRQGKIDQHIMELERLVEINPNDRKGMMDLSKIYEENSRYDDQIFILQKVLELYPNDNDAQSALANAFENTGRDPIEIFKKRYEDNPNNLSNGLEYVKKLNDDERYLAAVDVLNSLVKIDPSSKIAHRKLAEAHKKSDNLERAADAFQELFKIDSRDARIAIEISEVFLLNNEFGKALRWSEKSISIDNKLGDAFAQKAKVFYDGWKNFNQNPYTIDDRIVAKLSYDNYVKAESKGYRGESNKKFFEDNAKDVLYGKAQWFMADDKIKRTRVISTLTSDYDWVTESLKPESSWK